MSQLINRANKSNYNELINLWEESVRATHHFLTDIDIAHYRLLIYDYYFDGLELYYLCEQAEILGFIGLKQKYIQMLFVSPQAMHNGVGKKLITFAIDNHGAREVDVNEQNTGAVKFYKKMGFSVTGRSERDAAGKPFPVLSLALNRAI